MEKWKKLMTFIEWLSQGREFEFSGYTYKYDTASDSVFRMFDEESGWIMDSLPLLFEVIDTISESDLFLMNSEIALTKLGLEQAAKREEAKNNNKE